MFNFNDEKTYNISTNYNNGITFNNTKTITYLRKTTMKTEKQIWKDINKPKTEELWIEWDENEDDWFIAKLLDRIPIFLKERRQQK